MAKIYRKTQLSFVNGYIVDGSDNVVALPYKVAEQLNDLEEKIQLAAYMEEQGEARPAPSADGFVRRSAFTKPVIEVETPHLDAELKRSLGILEDLRAKDHASKANAMIESFTELFDFVSGDSFVEGNQIVRTDTPTIGNPLDVTIDRLLELIGA